MKKILHVGKYFAPIEGGIESINKVIVDSLNRFSQRIISFNNTSNTVEEDVDGIPILRSATEGVISSQPLSVRYFWDLRRILKYYKPDVVHFHYPNPLIAFYLLILLTRNTKLIVHWHSDIIAQKYLYRFIQPIERRILRRADIIIATSENYKNNSSALKDFLSKVVVIPCSIDVNSFSLADEDKGKVESIKQQYNYKPIILFIGRHVEYKGIEYLLEAEQYIKTDCEILIGGSGPETDRLKNKYSSKRIHWLGRISEKELKHYYYAADILAFPSITKNEAFGVVLAEAMYCYTTPVTFTIDGSGVNWVALKDKTSLEVPNKNVHEYAAAIDSLLKDQKLNHLLSENGHRRVIELFSTEAVEPQYQQLYNDLINS